MSRVTVAIDVGQLARAGGNGDRFSATTELGGASICTYGSTQNEAERRAKGAILRHLGNLLERGAVELDEVRFRTKTA